ncbi:hypothetical protein ACQR1W_11690 [Bradyrhizobium sp. HKCCYLS1011]|uniref:hypothetical protein n=1 Tax=Bradyrhizobium sp. HKCCYLS1011 TaxID=3420733 RepID=UPI003EBC1A4D
MSKLIAIVASVKAVAFLAAIGVARGEMLPVILISALFNLTQIGRGPAGLIPARETLVVRRGLSDQSD